MKTMELKNYVVFCMPMHTLNYSKTSLKRPLKKSQNNDLNDKW